MRINTTALAKLLELAGKAVTAKADEYAVAGKDYLGRVRISASDRRLTLRVTDLNSDVTVSIPADAAEFEAIVNPNPLLQVLKMMDDIVEIKVSKNGDLSVEAGRNKSNFKSEDVEFPKASIPPAEAGISLGRKTLVQALSQVAFAASRGLERPALQGVFFEFSKDGLHLVAADGFRLAVRKLAVENGDYAGKQIILPAEAMSRLAKALGRLETETVTFHIGRGRAFFVSDGETVSFQATVQAIEANFPAWRDIVPAKHEGAMGVDIKELAHALKVARLFAISSETKTFPARLMCHDSGEDVLEIRSAGGGELGDVVARIPLSNPEGTLLDAVAVNARFLTEWLPLVDNGACPEPRPERDEGPSRRACTVKLQDSPEKPVLLETGDASYLVMPLYLRE